MVSREPIAIYRPPVGVGPDATLPAAAGRSIVGVCWRRKWTVVAVAMLVITGAIAYLASAPRIFTGRSRLFVPQNGQRLLIAGPDPQSNPSDAYQFRQVEIIRAEPVLKQVAESVETIAPKTFAESLNPLADLQKGLDVGVGKKDEIITISFDCRDPEEAAAVTNAIVAAYRQYSSDENQSSAAGMLRVLRSEKGKQEKTLDDKLKEIVAFKQKNGEMFFTTDRGVNITVQNLAAISGELTRANLDATSAYAAYLQAQNKPLALKVWRDAKLKAEEFERYFESEKAKALKLNDAQAEYQKLQIEADRTTKLLDLLDTRMKELSVTEDAGAMNIQVLEVAKAETKPTSPKKSAILLAAMALGLGLGAAAAFAHEALDQKVHTPDEAGRLLGLPVLGVIPVVRHAVASARKQLGRAVFLAPNSDVAEAFRSLRAAVYYGWPDKSVKSVCITSPERGDGKSTTASNLALAMAQAGLRVVLVDADLRAAVQHKVFDVSNTVGLSDVVGFGVAVEQAIRRTDTEGLVLLPAGTPAAQPAEITNGQGFGKLLQSLEAAYDLVVIDAPPLLAVADARILGAQAGLTILTLRADKSTRHEVRAAVQQLVGVGSSILGVVLNGVTQRRRTYETYAESDMVPDRNLMEPNLIAGRPLPGHEAGNHALTI